MVTGVYALLNFVSNKIYVGQAINIQKRWKNHRIELRLDRHRNIYMQAAYNKYGQHSFIFYVIEECEVSELDNREQYWMDFYNSYNREFGFNLSPTSGGSSLGYKHSDETKALQSAQRKGKFRSDEAKANIKAGWIKRKENGPVSEETKKKQSESHKGQNHTQEFKEAAKQRMIGNTFRLGKKTGKRSPEVIANVVAGRKQASRKREKDLLWTW